MELDDAFKMAVKKFYEGSTHQNVDKYSKTPFKYSFQELDALHKGYKKKTPESETPDEESVDTMPEGEE